MATVFLKTALFSLLTTSAFFVSSARLRAQSYSSFVPNSALTADASQDSEKRFVFSYSDEAQACLRIPASLIRELLARDFTHDSTVDRVVMGTHSRGKARCTGKLSCTFRETAGAAELVLHLSGNIVADTKGINGPAVIYSTATTAYTATKTIAFDGSDFVTTPVNIDAETDLKIRDVDSTARGLRGIIVSRVGRNRAHASHAEAEAVTEQLTEAEVRERINAEVDARVQVLNAKYDALCCLLRQFACDRVDLAFRTEPDYLELRISMPAGGGAAVLNTMDSPGRDSWLGLFKNALSPANIPVSNALTGITPEFAKYLRMPQFAGR